MSRMDEREQRRLNEKALEAAIRVYGENERLSVTGNRARAGARSVVLAYLNALDRAMSGIPEPNQQWRYKPQRGYGTFTVASVGHKKVTLRDAYTGRQKTLSLETLRKDYELA